MRFLFNVKIPIDDRLSWWKWHKRSSRYPASLWIKEWCWRYWMVAGFRRYRILYFYWIGVKVTLWISFSFSLDAYTVAFYHTKICFYRLKWRFWILYFRKYRSYEILLVLNRLRIMESIHMIWTIWFGPRWGSRGFIQSIVNNNLLFDGLLYF